MANSFDQPVVVTVTDLTVVLKPITDDLKWNVQDIVQELKSNNVAIAKYVWEKFEEIKAMKAEKTEDQMQSAGLSAQILKKLMDNLEI